MGPENLPMPSHIDLTVYPADCDAFGHLNQAAFLALFERARWDRLAQGPGLDLFTRGSIWPAVRKTAIEYLAPAFPGDRLRFTQTLLHHGRTSFTMRQTARRVRDDALIAAAEFVFVCIDQQGRPVPAPEEIALWFDEQPADGPDGRRTVNGVALAVDVTGDGPAVLFVHGYPLCRGLWRHQVSELPGWRSIAPDLRGMGQSDAPDLGYSISTYAADLLALLDLLMIDQAVICGHSMGGYVAFEILRQARSRVRAMVLLATRAAPDSSEGRKGREAAMALAREKGAAAVAESMLPRVLAPATLVERPAVAEEARRMMAATPVAGIVGALGAMRDRPDSAPLLGTLEGLPVLLIAGAGDQLIPSEQMKEMAGQIPGATFHTVAAAGHLIPLEQPEAVNRLLRDFLDRLG